jgi:hypothetical protein
MNGKPFPSFCESLAQRLYIDYPEMYQKVLATIKDLMPKTTIAVEKPTENEALFYRTQFVLEAWAGVVLQSTNETIRAFIDRLDSLIDSLPESKAKNLIQEVASFELEKYEFVQSLPDFQVLKAHFQEESNKINQALNLPIEAILDTEIVLSPFAKLIATEWNWAEKNEFALQRHGFDYLANLHQENAYYKVALLICIEQTTLQEMLLDVVSSLLLEALEEKQTMRMVINQVVSQVKNHLPNMTEAQLADLLLDKVRYFLYHHVLQLA